MRALLATWRSAVAEAAANRASLLSQMAIMALNDAVWVVFWVLFFDEVGDLRGYDTERILMLQAVLTTGGGVALGLLANARSIGTMAVNAELDAVLTLPVPTLAHVLLRRIEPVNLGDVAFGLVLFAVAGDATVGRTLVFLAGSLLAAVLLVSVLVLTGSLAFFLGRAESGELGFHSMLLTGAYPADVYSGTAKVLLHTVLPAAFVATVPARLVFDLDPPMVAAFVAVTTVFAVAAWATFNAGLRRYTSGSVWTRA